jgi:endonuclease I
MTIITIACIGSTALADPPPGYYSTVDDTSGATMRSTLHAVIDDHTRFPYTSGGTDTWDILEDAQENPSSSSQVIDIYRNRAYTKMGGGSGPYNREHTWPKSYGFPNDGASNYPYTDCHQLHLCDSGYNSSRSNKPFRNCNSGCSEETTDANNGEGGGSGSYPGNSNWTSGSFASGTWETWIGRRGDVARTMFYLDVRYEGGTHGVTNHNEPNLILTNTESLIDNSNTGSNESVAYMGILSVLRQWHLDDPVDDFERDRNDVVFGYQGNRNPFVDHPEWVACLYDSACTPGGGPATPQNLVATAGNAVVNLNWSDNTEPDLDGYNVHRATVSGGPYTQINGPLVGTSQYTDLAVTNGTTFFYTVTAMNTSSDESGMSSEASATPTAGGGTPAGDPWINEFHYDNNGGDTGEFFEIAGAAGTNLSGWSVVGYNGNGGASYNTIALSGVIPDQGGCMGTLSFSFTGMQNGAPDGLALVDDVSAVIEFLSYEGGLTATNGPASGMSSTNTGVSESSGTPVGFSLQKSGTGSESADFSWQPEGTDTPGQPNTGQVFDGCSGCVDNEDCDDGLFCNGAETCDAAAGCLGGASPCPGQLCNEGLNACVDCLIDADCDDGLFCNGAETCVAGVCQAGTAPNCDDSISCTTDSCNEATDSCDHATDDAACDDGSFCTGDETCVGGSGCVSSGDPCTGLFCDDATDSCVDCLVDAHCADGLFCNGIEVCDSGSCVGGTGVDCNDGLSCTTDTCNESLDQCDYDANDAVCDDGLFCNGPEACVVGNGCVAGGIPCTGQLCDEAGDGCVDCVVDNDCGDALFCNGTETCNAGACQPGSSVDCDDGFACTVDTCNETTDVCENAPTDGPCDDGLFCNGVETCAVGVGCIAGTMQCSKSLCDEVSDQCVDCLVNDDCSDGLFCNGAELCDAGGTCQPGSPPCTGQICDDGLDSCVECLSDTDCDDGSPCTSDSCDIGLGQCEFVDAGTCGPDCCDTDSNDVRDDACGFCTRDEASCSVTPLDAFADMGGAFGDCPADGFANIHDRNHALTCFSVENPCDPINHDCGGSFGSCAPDGFCNIHDANHALTAFAGTSSCSCPTGPSPEFPPSIVGTTHVRLKPSSTRIFPGRLIEIDVMINPVAAPLQSYQVELHVTGGSRGALDIHDIYIDSRRDRVWKGGPTFSAVNVDRGMMLAGVDRAERSSGSYLATFVMQASTDARGTFVIEPWVSDHGTVLISDFDAAIDITGAKPVVVAIR